MLSSWVQTDATAWGNPYQITSVRGRSHRAAHRRRAAVTTDAVGNLQLGGPHCAACAGRGGGLRGGGLHCAAACAVAACRFWDAASITSCYQVPR
jgi:hypothetical protein